MRIEIAHEEHWENDGTDFAEIQIGPFIGEVRLVGEIYTWRLLYHGTVVGDGRADSMYTAKASVETEIVDIVQKINNPFDNTYR